MLDNTRRARPEPAVETYDDDINGPGLAPYRYVRSRAAKADFHPDDPSPLFLSSDGPSQHDLEALLSRDRRGVSRRVLKAAVLTASVTAILFTLFFEEATRAVIVNAKASFSATQPRQSEAAPAPSAPQPLRDVRLANAGPPAPDVDITGSNRASPTRQEIASAFQTALQSQPAIPQPAPSPAPAARRLDADELAALLKRAKGLIAIGDIAPARLLLERAADAQEAGAALLLAQTYDPVVLGTPDARSITPDPATARGWYQKAARLGSREAQLRLDQMPN
jgi:hypothetical protein